MQKNIYIKLGIIAGLTLAIQIAVSSISGIVGERELYRVNAQQSIATAWAGEQAVIGPILRVPYTALSVKKTYNPQANVYEEQTIEEQRFEYLSPHSLEIKSHTTTEERYRGIYSFPVHTTNVELVGSFRVAKHLGQTSIENLRFDKESIVDLGIRDTKGIAEAISITSGKESLTVVPGVKGNLQESGIHASLGTLDVSSDRLVPFSIVLKVKGLQSFQVAALGETTTIAMSADWNHPKFVGSFLPASRTISENGFKANWSLTHFATGATAKVEACRQSGCDFSNQLVGFELYQPVDLYQQTERSLKYAILFITMTFASFFIFELMKDLRIHPVQYAFVGSMQAIFYLLLISLSEHLNFLGAYLLATIGCVTMLAFYLSSVLQSASRGIGYGAAFAFLYAVLYFLLQSEDYALLMGAALLFATLSAAMTLTRRVDWYGIQRISLTPDSTSAVRAVPAE
jgi:inner membrane protein